MEDHKSWEVKDDALYDDLVTLMGLTDEDCNAIVNVKAYAEKNADEMTDYFYEHLLAHENTADFLHGQDLTARKKTIRTWYLDLFSGKYDAHYVEQRLKIGQVHVRIGLPVRYPLAMIALITEYGLKAAIDDEAAKRAFHKLLALDIAIFNQSYENTQLQHLAETVGNERLARRLLMQ